MSNHTNNEQCSTQGQCETTAPAQADDCCDMPERLLALADEAFNELLKDKLKERILAKKGDTLDKLADLVAETNCAKWSQKLQAKKGCQDYKQGLMQIMTACSAE